MRNVFRTCETRVVKTQARLQEDWEHSMIYTLIIVFWPLSVFGLLGHQYWYQSEPVRNGKHKISIWTESYGPSLFGCQPRDHRTNQLQYKSYIRMNQSINENQQCGCDNNPNQFITQYTSRFSIGYVNHVRFCEFTTISLSFCHRLFLWPIFHQNLPRYNLTHRYILTYQTFLWI